MANLKILSKTMRYGLLYQSAWASPLAANSNFKTMAYDASVSIPDPGVTKDLYNTTAQNGIHREYERIYTDARSGLQRLNFSMVADNKTLAPHLAGALFAVSEAAGTPYAKTFTCGGLTSAIDFANDAGILHTIAVDQGASADDGIVLENAIIDQLTLDFDFLATGVARLGQISGTWVGNEMNFEQTLSGTWTTTTLTPYNDTDTFSFSTFTGGITDYSSELFRKFTLQINNNVTTSAATVNGKAQQYDIKPEYTIIIHLDYNSVTEKTLEDIQDAPKYVITFTNDIAVGTQGNLEIAAPNCQLETMPFAYNNEYNALVQQLAVYSNSAATPLTIKMTDSIDWTY